MRSEHTPPKEAEQGRHQDAALFQFTALGRRAKMSVSGGPLEVAALRWSFAPLLFFAAAICLGATAEAQLPFKVAVAGGWTGVVSPSAVTDYWNGGCGLSVGLHFRPGARLGVWTEIAYHRCSFDNEAFESAIAGPFPDVNTSGNELYVLPVTAGAEYALTGWGNTRPYVSGGLGYYHFATNEAAASGPAAGLVQFPDPSDDAFGVRIGLGVRTLVTPAITLFVDASYHHAWASPDPIGLVPIRLGFRF